jgi:uncharacterized iron-regulated membrane protein
MNNRALRRWSWVHKWTSIVSTVFLLMLCITGLPLIFHHEIDELLHVEVEPADLPATTPPANLDAIAQSALAQNPGKAIQFFAWDKDEPHVTSVFINHRPDGDLQRNWIARIDSRTAAFLDQPDIERRLTYILLRLHTDLFAGLPGKLFLGVMGLFFVVAIVSGVVVYGPSMGKSSFGTVRRHRLRVVRWLDLHNLMGITIAVWMVVVGLTGVINTWADLVIKFWQYDQVAQMLGPHRDKPYPATLVSIEKVVNVAREKLPAMEPRFVAYPGNPFSAPAHFIVFMTGREPLTSKLLQPVIVDGATGEFTDTRPVPWYVATLLLSQPLHFGDYGGMPLKIIWAILDVMTIVILVTGLYLWLFRRRSGAAAAPIFSEPEEAAAVVERR